MVAKADAFVMRLDDGEVNAVNAADGADDLEKDVVVQRFAAAVVVDNTVPTDVASFVGSAAAAAAADVVVMVGNVAFAAVAEVAVVVAVDDSCC